MDLTGGYNFPQAAALAYLDTAAEGLPFPGCEDALAAYFRDKSRGTPGRSRLHEAEHETRELAARLLGAAPGDVALLSNATEGLNLLANSIPWRSGDQVILTDLEFPSNVLPWLRLRDQGVCVCLISSTDGVVTLNQFAQAITPQTRLITVSEVSYKTGTRFHFLPALARLAHEAGACLCVDSTQSLGRIPVSIVGVDYLVASGYKWLLAPHGLGLVYLSPALRDRLSPGAVGWYSVREIFTEERFDHYECKPGAEALVTGMPNFPGIYAMGAALKYLLEIGPARIDAGLRPWMEKLRAGLGALGLDLLTPPGAEFASGIVSFAHPAAAAIGAELERRGVVVWTGDGRVRASLHLYNREADVDRYLAELASLPELDRA